MHAALHRDKATVSLKEGFVSIIAKVRYRMVFGKQVTAVMYKPLIHKDIYIIHQNATERAE